jgi:putative endopeptidase
LANRVSAGAWQIADSLAELDQPVDRMEWLMLPQTVNAYYMPPFNQIVFPAAILQAPFFDAEADPAVNYGAIGAVIGHEIGHGFDDAGSRYDGTGTLRNWWQPEDNAGFMAEAGKLITLIEQYCTDDGDVCLTGRQSLGETLGDVVGLQMAYRAYRLSLNGAEAPVLDGVTGDQRFFLGFAQIWRSVMRPAARRNQMIGGTHPPSDFRLNNAIRHLDAWYEAFDVGPEDPLYLPPEQRVSIW